MCINATVFLPLELIIQQRLLGCRVRCAIYLVLSKFTKLRVTERFEIESFNQIPMKLRITLYHLTLQSGKDLIKIARALPTSIMRVTFEFEVQCHLLNDGEQLRRYILFV